ncbi:Glucomannan 4-beta-mannosyltransferase [[Leptolyngbya] sp. PCC 7376]|uniref:glycosyltransferase n=1 Tax=[Leptolyngbya] sp. PCC 7376 TaxID=111781 RepID=UPI00029F38EF|nr:glycosyltransferase [[Leptolyngbya] sp. PCC 7376]AFY40284.1 Glucomannan 4-beta-mannosyltransferase [[Leptolyngbya] sp. PCC 7376]
MNALLSKVLLDLTPVLYLSILLVISIYGFHKLVMLWRFYKYRTVGYAATNMFDEADLPKVTVQLPIFNELYVVERLLEAIAELHYPPDKLEIQVLDDSTDETQWLCQNKVEQLQERINIHYIRRPHRQGFKAGALDYGLKQATGELITIFDADFVPQPETLLQMVNYFTDPSVGMVQARWAHLNRKYSLLTEVQALMLDGHFVIEQTARNRAGCFFNFNGTAGIWRASAIVDAGGWQHTTVTEDLDLSYRVQLKDWNCIYLPHIVVPAELPMEMNSFKSQQFRWAKGASQVAKKILGSVLRAKIPLHVKFEAFLHLTNNFNYLLLMVLLLLSLPYQIYISQHQWEYGLYIYLPIFVITTLNLFGFYWVSQRAQNNDLESPWRFGYHIFFLLSLGIGMSLNQSLAVCDGLLRFGTEFVRTPKHGLVNRFESWKTKKYRGAKTWVVGLELLMLTYLAITIGFALYHGHFLSLPFLVMFFVGYAYVLKLGLFQYR